MEKEKKVSKKREKERYRERKWGGKRENNMRERER